ncbi:MAG: DUF4065 domain-containing protein [Candidatus Saccharibacteria bacterium]|nr:DUF4065 domain-containing protein [Candidatus Saccharibacteria bacterium]
MEDKNIFRINLRKYRKMAGLTQEQFAKHLGISRVSYNKLEQGDRVPSLDDITNIARILNISMLDLLDIGVIPEAHAHEKFEQVYHYILNNYFPEGIPKTKLAKILYLIDFSNYYLYLDPMTEATYFHKPYGPVADVFLELTDALYEEARIDIQINGEAMLIKPVEKHDDNLITDRDKKLIEKVCDYWKDRRTKEIVNFTHQQLPYKTSYPNNRIPFYSIGQEAPDNVFAPVDIYG